MTSPSSATIKSWVSDKLTNAVITAIVGLAVMNWRVGRAEKDIERLETKHDAVMVRMSVLQSAVDQNMTKIASDISDIKGYMRGRGWSDRSMLPDESFAGTWVVGDIP